MCASVSHVLFGRVFFGFLEWLADVTMHRRCRTIAHTKLHCPSCSAFWCHQIHCCFQDFLHCNQSSVFQAAFSKLAGHACPAGCNFALRMSCMDITVQGLENRWLSMFFEHAVRFWYLWSGVEKPSGCAVAGRPKSSKSKLRIHGFPTDSNYSLSWSTCSRVACRAVSKIEVFIDFHAAQDLAVWGSAHSAGRGKHRNMYTHTRI